ncbi:MAG: HEAT repeat domain-containing protein [Deltaproteobacteria bacterium]|nr:HEAT repeat domain-containing protein [Deltaproteobacteria bacterium]
MNGVDARKAFSEAAKAAGRVFRFLGKLRPRKTPASEAPDESAQGREQIRLAARRIVLENQIARLEKDLDGIYSQVVQGTSSVRTDESHTAASRLTEHIKRSRDLREQLRMKHIERARLERSTARELKLRQGAASGSSPLVAQRPAFPKQVEERKGTRLSPKARHRILKSSRDASFQDGSQKVVFDKLVQDLLGDETEIRRTAVARLGELGTVAVRDILCIALEDPDDKVRAVALNSLALQGDASVVGLFRVHKDSADPHIRLAALRGLARVGDPHDDEVLLAALEDDHPAVRKAASSYLGWRGARGATAGLVSALHDPDPDVRISAAASLGAMRDDRAVLSLIRALGDADRGVREAAKSSLETLLGEKIDVDVEAGQEDRTKRIDQLKEWWKEARVGKHLEREDALGMQRKQAEALPAARAISEPPGADSAQVGGLGKIVDLKSAAASRGRPKQDLDEGEEETGMPAELEALRTVEASEKTAPAGEQIGSGGEGALPEELEALGGVKTAEEEESTAEVDEGGVAEGLPEELEALGSVKASAEDGSAEERTDEGEEGAGDLPEELAALGTVKTTEEPAQDASASAKGKKG